MSERIKRYVLYAKQCSVSTKKLNIPITESTRFNGKERQDDVSLIQAETVRR